MNVYHDVWPGEPRPTDDDGSRARFVLQVSPTTNLGSLRLLLDIMTFDCAKKLCIVRFIQFNIRCKKITLKV